jgi:hypothetical protein
MLGIDVLHLHHTDIAVLRIPDRPAEREAWPHCGHTGKDLKFRVNQDDAIISHHWHDG